MGNMAVTYRALAGTAYTAPVIDQMELWQIAVVLGEDIGPPPLILPREPDPPRWPAPPGAVSRLEFVT